MNGGLPQGGRYRSAWPDGLHLLRLCVHSPNPTRDAAVETRPVWILRLELGYEQPPGILHRAGCPLLLGRDDVRPYRSKRDAKAGTCPVCDPPLP